MKCHLLTCNNLNRLNNFNNCPFLPPPQPEALDEAAERKGMKKSCLVSFSIRASSHTGGRHNKFYLFSCRGISLIKCSLLKHMAIETGYLEQCLHPSDAGSGVYDKRLKKIRYFQEISIHISCFNLLTHVLS
jgi:hypothetical protein